MQNPLSFVLPILRRRFEGQGDNALAFHPSRHTINVYEHGQSIAHAMGLVQIERDLVGVGCAFHDTVQNWEQDTRDDGAIVRRRFVGKNEEASADEAYEWMERQGYNQVHQTLVREGIRATVPIWDAGLGTVVQNINKTTHPVIRAIAMADLAPAGMNATAFASEGDLLFIEEQLDITRAIRSGESISSEKQKWFLSRYIKWTESQVPFAQGRKLCFPLDIEGLPALAQHNLSVLFSQFDRSIELAAEMAEYAKTMSFETFREIYQN